MAHRRQATTALNQTRAELDSLETDEEKKFNLAKLKREEKKRLKKEQKQLLQITNEGGRARSSSSSCSSTSSSQQNQIGRKPKRNGGGLFAVFVGQDDDEDSDDDQNESKFPFKNAHHGHRGMKSPSTTTSPAHGNSPTKTADSAHTSKYSADMFTAFIEEGRKQANETMRRKTNARIEQISQVVADRTREMQKKQRKMEKQQQQQPNEGASKSSLPTFGIQESQDTNNSNLRYVAAYCEVDRKEQQELLMKQKLLLLSPNQNKNISTNLQINNSTSQGLSDTLPTTAVAPTSSSPFSRQFVGDDVIHTALPSPTNNDNHYKQKTVMMTTLPNGRDDNNDDENAEQNDEEASFLSQLLPQKHIKKVFQDNPSASRQRRIQERKEEMEFEEKKRRRSTTAFSPSSILDAGHENYVAFENTAHSQQQQHNENNNFDQFIIQEDESSLTVKSHKQSHVSIPNNIGNLSSLPQTTSVSRETSIGRTKNNNNNTTTEGTSVVTSALSTSDEHRSLHSAGGSLGSRQDSLISLNAMLVMTKDQSGDLYGGLAKANVKNNSNNNKHDGGEDDQNLVNEDDDVRSLNGGGGGSVAKSLTGSLGGGGGGGLRQAKAIQSATIVASEQKKKVVGWRETNESNLFSDPRTRQKIVGFSGMSSDEVGFDAAVTALTNEANVVQKEGKRQRWWAQQRQNALEKEFRDRVIAAVEKGEKSMNETLASREALESLVPMALNEAQISSLAFAEGRARWVVEADERYAWNELLVEFFEV